MFKDLTVGNLGPFRDDAMLTMHATTLTEHKGNIVDGSNDAILSSAIIFGPNASGKTSIVGAFRTLQDLVSSFDWVDTDALNRIPEIAREVLSPENGWNRPDRTDAVVRLLEDRVGSLRCRIGC